MDVGGSCTGLDAVPQVRPRRGPPRLNCKGVFSVLSTTLCIACGLVEVFNAAPWRGHSELKLRLHAASLGWDPRLFSLLGTCLTPAIALLPAWLTPTPLQTAPRQETPPPQQQPRTVGTADSTLATLTTWVTASSKATSPTSSWMLILRHSAWECAQVASTAWRA